MALKSVSSEGSTMYGYDSYPVRDYDGPSPSTYGKLVQRALVGYRDCGSERTGRVYELPALLPLGRPDLLLGSTRRTLCRARDRALEAQQASVA